MAADLKLDTATGDISIENGDLAVLYDNEATIQRLKLRLSDVRGNWFRNTNYGTDWFGSILGKRSMETRRAEFRRVIRETEDVAQVARLETEFDGTTRQLVLDFTAIADDGTELDVRFTDILSGGG